MSYFEPSKRTSTGASFIAAQRERFRQMVMSATSIAVVGVRVRPRDVHIWEPLASATAPIMYCAGRGAADVYRRWQSDMQIRSADIVLSTHFKHAIDDMCAHVGIV